MSVVQSTCVVKELNGKEIDANGNVFPISSSDEEGTISTASDSKEEDDDEDLIKSLTRYQEMIFFYFIEIILHVKS
jgi:hypothetical protein